MSTSTIAQLKKQCKDLKIKGYSKLSKKQMILLLENHKNENHKNENHEKNDNNYKKENHDKNDKIESNQDPFLNQYTVGDNLELLQKIASESVDLVYMDPPYNTGRDFYYFQDK